MKSINKYISFDLSLHKALSEFNQLILDEKASLNILLTLLLDNWINLGYACIYEEELFKNRALVALMNYYRNPLDKGYENLIVDKFITYKAPNNSDLTSKIDKLHELNNGLFEVVDYKSGLYLPPKENMFNSLKVHKTIYVVYQKLGVYPDLFSYYYLRYNKKFTFKITKEYTCFLQQVLNSYGKL